MKKWNCGNWNSFEYIWISPKILSFLAKYLFSSLMYNIIYMNMIYLLLYLIKQIDSTLPSVCKVIDYRRCQYVVEHPQRMQPLPNCATCLFLPLFAPSVIYYWTDTQKCGIYLWDVNFPLRMVMDTWTVTGKWIRLYKQ